MDLLKFIAEDCNISLKELRQGKKEKSGKQLRKFLKEKMMVKEKAKIFREIKKDCNCLKEDSYVFGETEFDRCNNSEKLTVSKICSRYNCPILEEKIEEMAYEEHGL